MNVQIYSCLDKTKFVDGITVVIDVFRASNTIISCLDTYAKEKARLRKKGLIIDEFDLLIGSSAIENNMMLVTRNVKHFNRLKGSKIENWVDEQL